MQYINTFDNRNTKLMYIKIPVLKKSKILMLRTLSLALQKDTTPKIDVVAPEEYQANLVVFEEKYEAYNLAKQISEIKRQSRDVQIAEIENLVVKIAQYLKVKFKGNEKLVVEWGFPILLGDRSGTIYRDTNSDSRIALYKKIVAKHISDGETSVLSSYNMAAFQLKLTTLVSTQDSYKQNRTLARIYSKQHAVVLDVLMDMARSIARNLRMREDMEPKDLEAYGFDVLDSSSKIANKTAIEDEDLESAS
jgi:hypothetical protein